MRQSLVVAMMALCLCACGGASTAKRDAALADTPRITPSAVCDNYLSCLSAADPEAFPTALQVYNPDGPCWQSSTAAEKCETACKEAYAKLQQLHPTQTECGGKPAPDSSVRPGSKDGAVYLDGAVVQPAGSCWDQMEEPNNSGDTATPITVSGHFVAWEICYPGDVDQFAFNVAAGGSLTVEVRFATSKGDLDAALVDPQGNVIQASRGTGDEEVLQLMQASPGGRYVVGVYGFGSAVNTYDLDVTLGP